MYKFLGDVTDTFKSAHYHLVPEDWKKTELAFNILSKVYSYHVMYLDILLNNS